MAFLDNTGDIILDAVLTDIGRKKLADGDGSFKITHFSLGDDEINYALYDTNLSTARRDLEILQTPILEAPTDSSAASKYRLLTLENNDLLFLPVARLNTKTGGGNFKGFPFAIEPENNNDVNQFVVVANQETADAYIGTNATGLKQFPDGFIDGTNGNLAKDNRIIIDQGLDTTQQSGELAGFGPSPGGSGRSPGDSPIDGPRGRRFACGIRPSIDVTTPTRLYSQLGSSTTGYGTKSLSVDFIVTTVRFTGLNLGITLDFQVKVIRKNN